MSDSQSKRPSIADAGGFISKERMQTLLTNYEKDHADQKATDIVKAMCFSKDKVLELLADDRAVGLRIYYGIHIDTDGDGIKEKKMVLVATDANGDDILPADVTLDGGIQAKSAGLILDDGLPCPNYCGGGGGGTGGGKD
ncbi:hypothetical protein CLV59_106275 [Chitinophaga dinghuensis]|uniref:Uncharacterized protein n=1 Tax=Chitinophaga dinghuensis TaxID=1539050 RepID=A0A327VWJ6_9BACT|nr:hypothetical protein [Chitinophaga dinghuensis]RAJ79214.1 hypothetical protein CLV59_106275 [Chitinophaga dinghuensis]